MQLFVILSPAQARVISLWPPMRDDMFFNECRKLAGGNHNVVRLIVPAIDWTLNVVLVSAKKWTEIRRASRNSSQYVHVQCSNCEVIFTRDDIRSIRQNGVTVSHWIKGDPQVSATRVSYEFTSQYEATFGTGYGSRIRSMCLDSINSYRDKRFSSRAHPSPLIHDADVARHQYYSASKQKSCLLQMKLETILHNLTSDVSSVAARLNPHVMSVVSGISTKLIATTGTTLYSFCNGLHVDSCDLMSTDWKRKIFKTEEDGVSDWHCHHKRFRDYSFPTTCGYQHVWKDDRHAVHFSVRHHFVMPGMGLAVSLDDSICHHFMGGAFAHCTSFCILEKEAVGNKLGTVSIRNSADFFRVFAWGSAANIRTSKGNQGRENLLGDHLSRREDSSNKKTSADIDDPDHSVLSRDVGSSTHLRDVAVAATSKTEPPDSSEPECHTHVGHKSIDTLEKYANDASGNEDKVGTEDHNTNEREHSDNCMSDDSSSCLLFEDDYYSDDDSGNKKRKGKLRRI